MRLGAKGYQVTVIDKVGPCWRARVVHHARRATALTLAQPIGNRAARAYVTFGRPRGRDFDRDVTLQAHEKPFYEIRWADGVQLSVGTLTRPRQEAEVEALSPSDLPRVSASSWSDAKDRYWFRI